MQSEVSMTLAAQMEMLEQRVLLSGDLPGATDVPSASAAMELLNLSSAVFVENQGQWADSALRYAFSGPGCGIGFRDSGLDFHLFAPAPAATDPAALPDDPAGLMNQQPPAMQSAAFSMAFVGANTVAPAGEDQAATQFNYFIGDQSSWRSNVPGYQVLSYSGLYNGIDLKTFGQASGLKYEFHVAPGADYHQIRVSYQGIEGLSIDSQGSLHIQTSLGEVIEQAPHIYQEVAGRQAEVTGQFVLVDDHTYAFALTSAYDPAQELIIDPGVKWSTYVGGVDRDWAWAVAVDSQGNILVTGETCSAGWTSGGYDITYAGNTDAFVVKLSPTGEHLWSTYLGGTDEERGTGIAVDSADNVVVTGFTRSPGWASGGYDPTYNGYPYDAFVAKLSPSGAHLWSTYVGGDDWDQAFGVAVDDTDDIVITGVTWSYTNWASGGFDPTRNGSDDAFVVKLSPSGQHIWSTYLGGGFDEAGYAIAVDSAGDILVTGSTQSAGWTSGGYDTSFNGSGDWVEDGFVAKLSGSGDRMIWSTYVGGTSEDEGYGIAVDSGDNVLVTGATQSAGWTSGGFDTSFNGGVWDAFVVKLTPLGEHVWSTYVGGGIPCYYNGYQMAATDFGRAIAVDHSDNILITGETMAVNWTSNGFDNTYNGGGYTGDAYVAKLSPSGSDIWSAYLGGSNEEMGTGIAVDPWGDLAVVGYTSSAGWVHGGYNTSFTPVSDWSRGDAFAAKISDVPPGDANFDRKVSVGDLGILAGNYGRANGATWSMGDFNGDGAVGAGDLGILAAHYGEGTAASSTAPGPVAESAVDGSATTSGPDGLSPAVAVVGEEAPPAPAQQEQTQAADAPVGLQAAASVPLALLPVAATPPMAATPVDYQPPHWIADASAAGQPSDLVDALSLLELAPVLPM